MAGHLTRDERDRIAHCRAQGCTQSEIAAALGHSRASISRELRRNGGPDGEYHACLAQSHAERRRRERPLTPDAERSVAGRFAFTAFLARVYADSSTSQKVSGSRFAK